MTINIKIKHGLESINKRFEEPVTVADILGNPAILAAIGASEASVALINGETVSNDTVLSDDVTVVLEKQAASKA
jgi:hypothetical protein